MRGVGVGLLLMVAVSNAWALEDYRCTVERVVSASVDNESLIRRYIGKQFTVDRASGRMAGALKNAYVTEPQVIDYGSTKESYKVVTTMRQEEGAGAGSNVYALTIDEYVEGTRKSFVFLENSDVYVGWCEHF